MPQPEPERRALRPLASANFAVGGMSYGVVGALPGLAEAWRISPGRAALLMAGFSISFAVGAPALQMLLGHLRRRTLLLGGLWIMTAATLAAACVRDFHWLLATRVVAGLAAGAVSPVANAIGAGLAPEARRGKALAVVFAGVTLASVAAAPLAAVLAHALGWRAVLVALAAMSAGSATWIWRSVQDHARGTRPRPADLLGLLRRPALATGLAVMVLQTAAFFTTYTLILPLLAERFGVGAAHGGLALLVFGLTGVAGNLLAQRVSLRHSADALLRLVMAVAAPVFVAIALLAALHGEDGLRQGALLVLLVAWALAQDLFYPSQLRRVVSLEPLHTGMAIALNSSCIFLGIALGSGLGGRLSDHVGLVALAPASAVLTGLAFVALAASRRLAADKPHAGMPAACPANPRH
ncbi:MFS transporter [Pseudoxanthomonas sp.]|uniref:MFS transporter n=1 Tax=Pseudoxanthomonas sp. TaxID=1871049 RepID=UPI00260B9FBA|nr:MFS transporter [Pseudoxanthomonas sp.]WDS37764.1 MAG: MFS transporter [Pseudoxanthomonas sp.]